MAVVLPPFSHRNYGLPFCAGKKGPTEAAVNIGRLPRGGLATLFGEASPRSDLGTPLAGMEGWRMNTFGRLLASWAECLAVLFLLFGLAVPGGSAALAAEGAAVRDTTPVGALSAPGGTPNAPADLSTAPASPSSEYLLHVGDRIHLWVWGEPSLTTDAVVMPDGTVSLPLVGSLQLLGKSVPAVTKEVTEACGRYLKDPRVSLSCTPQTPLRVYVEGSVNAPGPVPYDPRFRLLDYLGRAGGPTANADLSNVAITSVAGASVGTTKLDLSAPLRPEAAPTNGTPSAGGSADAPNPILSPGDTIWVGRAVPVAVIGAVRSPGAIDYRQGTRLSEYVSLAGGPTPRADLAKSLLRHTKDGVTASQRIDVARALTDPNAKESDPVLAPGDVLTVPEKFLAEGLTWSDVLRAVTAAVIWW
jgi:polysaccharide export outer membrane protein